LFNTYAEVFDFSEKIIMYNGGVDFYDANIMDYEKQVS